MPPRPIKPVFAAFAGRRVLDPVAERALDRASLVHAAIRDERVRTIVAGIERLPSVPKAYTDLLDAAASEKAGLFDVARIIASDVAMTAKVLELVNSAFFRRGQRITSIQQAVSRLGLGLIKGLVLSAHVFSTVDRRSVPGFPIEAFQAYSLTAARLAQHLVPKVELADDAFTAGLLHEVGVLVLALSDPALSLEVDRVVAKKACTRVEAERALYGATHAQAGAALLASWQIPFPIVEAALFHHAPHSKQIENVDILAAVHAAATFMEERAAAGPKPKLDERFLAASGLSSAVVKWRMVADRQLMID